MMAESGEAPTRTGSNRYAKSKRHAMIKIQIISLVLVLVLAVTLVNLFYKPWSRTKSVKKFEMFQVPINPLVSTQCPLRGFKCSDPHQCNCSKICPNDHFRDYHVKENDEIVVLDRKLEPGTYCLPEGFNTCNQSTEIPLYSLSGWTCISRNQSVYKSDFWIACKNNFAQNNDLNVLYDRLKNQPAKIGLVDFYETLNDHSPRYECHCDSVDLNGNKMVATLPFVCSVDYCLRELHNVKNLGWNNGKCECGPYPRLQNGDETAPCVGNKTMIENGKLHGRVECTEMDSYERKAWYCPGGVKGIMTFELYVSKGKEKTDFITMHSNKYDDKSVSRVI